MVDSVSLQNNEEFMSQLQDCATQLVHTLQNDNFHEASELIHILMEARDKHLFNSVGKLTRGLHDAIVNFQVDADLNSEPVEVAGSEIREASSRLHYVIELTQQAADKTMDKVEAVTPIAQALGDEASNLKDEWSRLKRREMTKEEFKGLYDRIDDFLDNMGDGTHRLNKSLQDILLEQGFQDLTGQVIKKVIGLVTDVEDELVNLMRIAGQVEQLTGVTEPGEEQVVDTIKAEGPLMNADKREDVVSGQDQVDDLLSSLGF